MQLSQSSVHIRPRSTWEAIDLGFAMVRVWWKPLCAIWLLPTLILGLFCYSFSGINLWLAAVLFWGLRIFLDNLLLSFFSQVLFNQTTTLSQSLKKLAHDTFKRGLWFGIFTLRFSLSRSFEQPVWSLESHPNIKARHQRVRLLSQSMQQGAIWLTLLCWGFEWLLYILLCFLITGMIPNSNEGIWLAVLHDSAAPSSMIITTALLSIISVICVEPFFVAAGFALYLNRRTQLEAWDIELLFRQLQRRLVLKKHL